MKESKNIWFKRLVNMIKNSFRLGGPATELTEDTQKWIDEEEKEHGVDSPIDGEG